MFLRKRANDRLTPAELRIVRAILAGHTTGQALRTALILAHGTITAHLESIYRKTGAQNKADVVLMARGEKACQIDLVRQLRDVPARDQSRKR